MNQARTGGWYFGWTIVAAATVLTLLTVGMRMGIGPFFLPMAEDLGFSRSLLAGIIAIGMLCYGLGMPLAGYLVGKYGTRPVLLLGTAIVVASIIWTVSARDPWSFFLAFGVLMSLGLAFTSPVALTPVISRWFTRQRGMALFFLSTGSMAGIAVMTPVLTYAIESVGWQNTLLGFAAVFTLVIVPTALPKGAAGTFIAGHMIQVRAFENQVFVAYINHCGADDRFSYAGLSRIAAPDGTLLAEAPAEGETLLFAEIRPEDYAVSRAENTYLVDLGRTG